VMKFWGGTEVKGKKNRYYQKRGHGWDVVNAIFAKEFEDLVAEFLEATEGTPPAAKSKVGNGLSGPCSVCGGALKKNSARLHDKGFVSLKDPVCTPVNCNHSFHVNCMIRYIANQDLYYSWSKENPQYPAVTCPCCSETFRPVHSDERVRNRSNLMGRCDDRNCDIWLPYSEVGGYMYARSWPQHCCNWMDDEVIFQEGADLEAYNEMLAQGASEKELREFERQKSKNKDKHHKGHLLEKADHLAKEHAHDKRADEKAHKHDHSHSGGGADKTGAYARQFSAGLGSLDKEDADEEAEMLAMFRQKQVGRQSFVDLDDTSGKLKELEEGAPIPRKKK